jgi:hypothetical protein
MKQVTKLVFQIGVTYTQGNVHLISWNLENNESLLLSGSGFEKDNKLTLLPT